MFSGLLWALWFQAKLTRNQPFFQCHQIYSDRGKSSLLGRPIYQFAGPNSGTQVMLLKFWFFSCISTKNILKLAINYFTMHLIILEWLTRQKCRKKRKKMRQREFNPNKAGLFEGSFSWWVRGQINPLPPFLFIF